MIAFTCPHCETAGNYSDYLGGSKMLCRFCRSPIRVPEAGPETKSARSRPGHFDDRLAAKVGRAILGLLGLIAIGAASLLFSAGNIRTRGSGPSEFHPPLMLAGGVLFLIALAFVAGSGALARKAVVAPKKRTTSDFF